MLFSLRGFKFSFLRFYPTFSSSLLDHQSMLLSDMDDYLRFFCVIIISELLVWLLFEVVLVYCDQNFSWRCVLILCGDI